MHLSSWCLYRRWRHHEVWVKQDKIEPVCPDKTVWRLSFYLSLCIEIINLSMSNLQIELVKPAAPEDVTKLVFSEVSWAKATSPLQSQQWWRVWSWLQNRPMKLHEYKKCPSQLLQAVLHRKCWFAERELHGPDMPGCVQWIIFPAAETGLQGTQSLLWNRCAITLK